MSFTRRLGTIKILLAAVVWLLAACGDGDNGPGVPAVNSGEQAGLPVYEKPADNYRNVYEVFVGSFYDSDGDGMGDLRGLTQKLDYISGTLGADAIWMMPIMPSPTYHKYDVTDYFNIDPAYGTLGDFSELAAACHERGVNVIIDLVLNHTSTEHPWFKEARLEIRENKELYYFNFYNIVNSKPNSSYYNFTGPYFYEGVFWSGMPDLNMDNDDLRKEITGIARFWVERGVDGFRLDAAKHVYNTERENIAFWTWFSEMCRGIKPDIYLVAEVWDSDSTIMAYYASGLDSMFNFGFAGNTGQAARAVSLGNGAELATRIAAYDALIKSKYANAINAPFLSNHDTDRSAGYFNNDEEKMKLAASVYMLIPGNSFIYYGEEIGMTGGGKDENKRAPMIWSVGDKTGQTRGPSGMTERPNLAEGAEEQAARRGSLLNRYREIIALKNAYPAIARGVPAAVLLGERALCVYEIVYGGERVLIAHNLSNEEKTAALSGVEDYQQFMQAGTLAPEGAVCVWEPSGGTLTLPGMSTAVLVYGP